MFLGTTPLGLGTPDAARTRPPGNAARRSGGHGLQASRSAVASASWVGSQPIIARPSESFRQRLRSAPGAHCKAAPTWTLMKPFD